MRNELIHKAKEAVYLCLQDAKDQRVSTALRDLYNELCCADEFPPSFFSHNSYNFRVYAKFFFDIDLDEINWDLLCEINEKTNDVNAKYSSVKKIHLHFVKYLAKNNLYKHPQADKLVYFIDVCNTLPTSGIFRNKLFSKDINLDSCFTYNYNESSDYPCIKLVDTKSDNPFIVNLLKDFLTCNMYFKKSENSFFAEKFIRSYKDLDNFDDISDFNYKVFEKQFKFYENNKRDLKCLIRFYVYLYVSSGYTNLFKHTDPIDITCLQRKSFIDEYTSGFRLVKYNPYEKNPPELDKWILAPNGFEKDTTQLNSKSYICLDFTQIKDKFYRLLAKKWFWQAKGSLIARRDNFFIIKDFIGFLIDYKASSIENVKNGVNLKEVKVIEVFSYRNFIISSTSSSSTINAKLTAVRIFLKYCVKEHNLPIQTGWEEYFTKVPKDTPKGGEDIPEADLLKIEEYLRERSGNSVLDSLYYSIFHIAIDTEFRINQILGLKIEDIKEGMKSDQFFIDTINKTSHGEKEMQAISGYTKRHLDVAIMHTQELRDNASSDYKDFIFLDQTYNDTAREARPLGDYRFRYYLDKVCTELGIKKYTPANLRDTHMTRAVEYGLKKGLSPLEISSLTGHVDSKTTNNHYVNAKVKTFAEATFGVVIGDIDIKGDIVVDSDKKFKKEDVVDDGCGFCRENKCKILSELGCLLCDGFVVTLDRIPFYEHKIKEIDLLIKKETIAHEKDHLTSRKKLYVAYLARLYTLKDQLSKKEG